MLWKKIKKKTLTISSNLKKKLTQVQLAPVKKSFPVEKKKPFKTGKVFNKSTSNF